MAVEVVLGALGKWVLLKVASHTESRIVLALGFGEDLSTLQQSLEIIQGVLIDAETKQVQNNAVRAWLRQLKKASHDAENVLDELSYYQLLRRDIQLPSRILREVRHFFPNPSRIAFRFKMANKIQAIRREFRLIERQAGTYNLVQVLEQGHAPPPTPEQETHHYIVSRVVGREADIEALVSRLVSNNHWTGKHEPDQVSVIIVSGMGGSGKTTLARWVFNDDRVFNYFDVLIWVSVSGEFVIKPVLQKMRDQIIGRSELSDEGALIEKLEGMLEGVKFLLVLDSINEVDPSKWTEFKYHLNKRFSKYMYGSKVVVTTRKRNVATVISEPGDLIELRTLSPEHCWEIIKGIAFGNQEIPALYEVIGREIGDRCRGLPLAATVLGGTLKNKDINHWESIKRELPQDDAARIISSLQPSFNHLKSSVKQCFAYCSKFPKNFRFDKEELVQLWVAEGFLPGESSQVMERFGNQHFSVLVEHYLFQDVEIDEYGRVRYCKMHDLVHKLACHVWDEPPFLAPGHDDNAVRTLVLPEAPTLGSFKSLRVLMLGSWKISALPSSIGKVKLLRYLDLSGTRIRALPKSVCKLYLLETIRLQGCRFLRKLPKELGNLVSLRRLYVDTEDAGIRRQLLPLQRKRFQSLERFPVFALTGKRGGRVEDLGDAENLGGELNVYNLEMVRNVAEARKAVLEKKEKVLKLGLRWSRRGDQDAGQKENDVMEDLRPHTNVKSLVIENFLGTSLASWVLLLTNLLEIQLIGCDRCLQIPGMGSLPCLRILRVWGMRKVACIGPEFYSNRGNEGMENSFPELKELELSEMDILVEWAVGGFPKLETMRIHQCQRLKTVPTHFPALVNLSIEGVTSPSPVLQLIKSGLPTLKSLSIKYVSKLHDLPENLLANNAILSRLVVESCPELATISHPLPTSLRALEVIHCGALKSLPRLGDLASLGFLNMTNCARLSLPEGLSTCTSLRRLTMVMCPQLNDKLLALSALHSRVEDLMIHFGGGSASVPEELLNFSGLTRLGIGGFSNELVEFPSLGPIRKILEGLEDLRLLGWPGLESLPAEIVETLSKLKYMTIRGFHQVEALPEWLGKLSSLEELWIEDCEKLKKFPTKEAMESLRELTTVFIYTCPRLIHSLKSHTGPEWSKISHLPNIISDSRFPE